MPPSRRALTSTPGDGRANRGSEPVAAAELGADKVAVFAESLAQCGDLNLQVLLRDNDARPHTAHKLVLGDQRSVGLQQDEKEIEGTRPQLYRTAIGDQLALAHQQRKRPNSSVASAAEGLVQAQVIGELSRRTDCRWSCMSLTPVDGVDQQIEANGALHAVPLNLRMNGCRLRIIPIILSFRRTLRKPLAAAINLGW